jgi:hypothetical protein
MTETIHEHLGFMMPNYAFERSVKSWSERAAGAGANIAPAARRPRLARPAQRGR